MFGGTVQGSGDYIASQAAQQIEASALALGLRLVKGVALEIDGRTQAYDYILLDRYGLLCVDLNVRPGEKITGRSADARWTGQVAGQKRQRFDNPIVAGAKRLDDLERVLIVCGRRFPREYFSELVVFVGADLSQLRISDAERLKLVDARDFAAALRSRYDFPVNPGAFTLPEADDLISLLSTLDRSDSRAQPTTEPVGRLETLLRRMGLRRGQVAVGVSDAAVGLSPVAPRLADSGYPVIENVPVKTRNTLPVLLLILLGVALVWMYLGGYATVVDRAQALVAMAMGAASGSQNGPEAAPAQAVPGLAEAQAVLQRSDPRLYGSLIDRDNPQIAVVQGITTYTWHYPDPNVAGATGAITLTFDGAGQLRGATQR